MDCILILIYLYIQVFVYSKGDHFLFSKSVVSTGKYQFSGENPFIGRLIIFYVCLMDEVHKKVYYKASRASVSVLLFSESPSH